MSLSALRTPLLAVLLAALMVWLAIIAGPPLVALAVAVAVGGLSYRQGRAGIPRHVFWALVALWGLTALPTTLGFAAATAAETWGCRIGASCLVDGRDWSPALAAAVEIGKWSLTALPVPVTATLGFIIGRLTARRK